MGFQSTQPKRAATAAGQRHADGVAISIHAAQEGCDFNINQPFILVIIISIHAAQEGCDLRAELLNLVCFYFNPRSPRGLRLNNLDVLNTVFIISIHAAQEGCDRTGKK